MDRIDRSTPREQWPAWAQTLPDGYTYRAGLWSQTVYCLRCDAWWAVPDDIDVERVVPLVGRLVRHMAGHPALEGAR